MGIKQERECNEIKFVKQQWLTFLHVLCNGSVDKNGDLYLGTGTVIRGYLERSNVDLAQEMVKVIESQRAYSYALRMVQTTS